MWFNAWVGRPETISCERCGTTVPVKAKGPVPSYCADCRKTGPVKRAQRPTVVSCQRCGTDIQVKSRGPLPQYCRDGCNVGRTGSQNARLAARGIQEVVPATPAARGDMQERPANERPPSAPTITKTAPSETRKRPVKPHHATDRRDAATETHRPRNYAPHPSPVLEAAEAEGPTVLTIAPVIPTTDANRRERLAKWRRWRNVISVTLWIVVALILVLVFIIGSRPAPPP